MARFTRRAAPGALALPGVRPARAAPPRQARILIGFPPGGLTDAAMRSTKRRPDA